MSIFKPEYETYQDVKSTLAWWSVPVWSIVVLVIYFALLTDEHRTALVKAIPGLSGWAAEAGTLTAVVVLGLIIAHLATHLLEIHDHWYDRYIVRWRDRYARQKMIPALIAPHLGKLTENAVEILLRDPGPTLKALFYPFASDRDMKIRKNLVVRFYERITKYWLSQMIEVACICLLIIALIYAAILGAWPPAKPIVWTVVAAILTFIIARIVAWQLRRVVWEATQEEIQDIHDSLGAEFEDALVNYLLKHGIAIQSKIVTS
jgi:hypothetical protein